MYFLFFSHSSHSFVFGQRKALTSWLVPGFRRQLFLKIFMVRRGQGEKERTRRAYRVARPVSYLLHPPHVPCTLIMLTFTPLAVFFHRLHLFSSTLSYCSLPFLLQTFIHMHHKMVSAILMEVPTEWVTESKQSWAYCDGALNLGQPYEHQTTLLLSYCVCSLHKEFKGHCTWAAFKNDFLCFLSFCCVRLKEVGNYMLP